MKLSVSAYRAHASAHKKILTSSYQQHYGSTAAPPCNPLHPTAFTPQQQQTITRRDSSLIFPKRIQVDQDDMLYSLPPKTIDTLTGLTSVTELPYTPRPWGSVRKEVITSLFETMVGCIVESWDLTEKQNNELAPASSNITISSKKKKTTAVKASKTKKSRSKISLNEQTGDPTQLLQQCWWSGPDERAVIRFKNGNVYEGNISMKCMHGEGRMQWADGSVYLGQFNDNEMNGRGTLQWKDDSWYEGEFAKNVRHGRGVYADSRTQRFYTGSWYCGTKNGKGFISYGKYNSYDGDWVRNIRHGFGHREYSDTSGYSGRWDMSVRSGRGMMIWPNHDLYKGGWKNGVMDGYGYYVWDATYNHSMSLPSHNSYRGYWHDGFRNGFGFLDLGLGLGSHYKGNFTENKKDGRGKFITNNGLILEHENLFYKDILGPIDRTEPECSSATSQCMLGIVKSPREFSICDETVGLSYHIEVALQGIIDNEDAIRINMVNEFIEKNYSCYSNIVTNGPVLLENNESDDIVTEIKDMMAFEEDQLSKSIRCYHVELKNIYYKYATLCNTEEISFTPILIRLFLWQFYYDINIHRKGLTLVEIDNLFHENKNCMSYKAHYPFERIYFWQFLHSLISVASKLYCKRHLPSPKPNTMVASAFRSFIKNDVLPGCSSTHTGRLAQGFGTFVPLNGLYELYGRIGEPHTVRQFLCAVRKPNHDIESPEIDLVEAPDDLPPPGRNMYIFGDWMTFIPDEKFSPEPFEPQPYENLHLFNFANLSIKTIINIFSRVLPEVCHEDTIINLDVQITFYEFFEVFVACAEESIRVTAEDLRLREKLENLEIPVSPNKVSGSRPSTVIRTLEHAKHK